MRRTVLALALAALAGIVAGPASASTHTVRNTDDSGEGSLRDAIDQASDGDIILFASDVRGEIKLSDPLDIDHDVSVKGPGADLVSVRGGEDGSVIDISADASITGLLIAGGESGIDQSRGKVTLIDCAVREASGAGVELGGAAKLTLVRSLIADNRGAGVQVGGGTATCVNSTVAGNETGFSVGGGHLTLANCTVAGNHGAGIANEDGQVRAQNSLLASNSPSCTGKIESQGYNLSEDDSCEFSAAGDQHGVDPQLGVLFTNGGRTATLVPGLGSPAIDSANPAGCTDPTSDGLLAVDQRGIRRPAGGRCDVGAVETQPAAVTGTVVNRILATVDGDPITLYELKDFSSTDPRLREAGPGDQPAVLDVLVTKRVIEKEVQAQGIVVQDTDIDRYVDNIRQRNNLSDEQLEAALAQQGLTRQAYRAQIKDELQRAQLINREIRGKVSVSPEEIERYYQEHKGGEGGEAAAGRDETGDAPSDGEVVISHIVLQIPPDASEEQVAAVEARAAKIHDEVEGGADFAEVAKRESEDGSAKSGGKLGTFKTSEMRDELANAIDGLDAGEISKPVRTGSAIHIVRVDERIGGSKAAAATGDAPAMPDAARDEIKEKLYAAALEERYNRWLKEDLRQRHHVEIRP